MLDINQIREILPHRYPMLLVDRIVEIGEDRIVGLKNVTANEPFFPGHFPFYPVMPGVLIVEAMAQVGAVLLLSTIEEREDKLVFFATIEQAKFRKPVVPGDQLRIEMQVLRRKATVCQDERQGHRGGQAGGRGDSDVPARRCPSLCRTPPSGS